MFQQEHLRHFGKKFMFTNWHTGEFSKQQMKNNNSL